MEKERPFEQLTLVGSPFERGALYGERRRDAIHQYIEYFKRIVSSMEGGEEALKEKIKALLPLIEEHSPSIAEEMRGIGEGCNRPYEDLVMLSLHEELKGIAANCTSFALTGNATEDGEVLQGQTWDIPVELCREAHPLLLLRKGGQGPSVFTFSYSGILAGAGFNEAGISLSWNSVPQLKITTGIPTYILIAELLQQDTIGGALKAIARAKRAGCFNLVITDTTEIFMVEATPDDIAILSSSAALGHANHYISPKFNGEQPMDMVMSRYNASSIVRQSRIDRLIEERIGLFSAESCQSLLKDHVNHPHSICRHPGDGDETPLITCAAWIIKPGAKTWWVSGGPPCSHPFFSYSL